MTAVPVHAEYLGPIWYRISQSGNRPKPKAVEELPKDVVPILAFDPGGTTGWSLLVLPKLWGTQNIFGWPQDHILRNKVLWHHGQFDCLVDENNAVYCMMQLINKWPSAAIVCEDFILRANRHEMSRELLSPVRITAMLEYELWRKRRKIWLQAPSQAKTLVTDERLKGWGVYTREGGLQHARDADRHALLFLRRCMGARGTATRNVAWPHLYEPEVVV